MKYRKRPVVIDAWPVSDLLRAARENWYTLPSPVMGAYERATVIFVHEGMDVQTLEGWMHANIDDWLICGVKGELYPCKPDVFAATYDAEQEADRPPRILVSGPEGGQTRG